MFCINKELKKHERRAARAAKTDADGFIGAALRRAQKKKGIKWGEDL